MTKQATPECVVSSLVDSLSDVSFKLCQQQGIIERTQRILAEAERNVATLETEREEIEAFVKIIKAEEQFRLITAKKQRLQQERQQEMEIAHMAEDGKRLTKLAGIK